MSTFTPISSAIGGVLIGVSATMILMLNGRICGISGILGGVVNPKRGDFLWRLLFVAGLLAGGAVMAAVRPESVSVIPGRSLFFVAIAGVLVGFGTRLGSGCTSGHGVCGISRLSKRSIVATMLFMATGALTVFATRHVFGLAT